VKGVGELQGPSTVGIFLFCGSLLANFHQPDPLNSGQEDGRVSIRNQITKRMDAIERNKTRSDKGREETADPIGSHVYMLRYYKVFIFF